MESLAALVVIIVLSIVALAVIAGYVVARAYKKNHPAWAFGVSIAAVAIGVAIAVFMSPGVVPFFAGGFAVAFLFGLWLPR
jgi:hypothetical protein